MVANGGRSMYVCVCLANKIYFLRINLHFVTYGQSLLPVLKIKLKDCCCISETCYLHSPCISYLQSSSYPVSTLLHLCCIGTFAKYNNFV